MNTFKPWYQSKTIIASLIAVGAALSSAMGHQIDAETQTVMSDVVLQAVAALASITAIVGRLTADAKIS